MPSSVGSLIGATGISRTGVVRWGVRIPAADKSTGTGVYLVALTDEFDSVEAAVSSCFLSQASLNELLERRPELTLDGQRPGARALGERLAEFWCPDEVVLYIGRAGPRRYVYVSELSDRVEEYYATPLGDRSPHAGGWPLKMLGNLNGLYVHYAYCDDVEARERIMLETFSSNLSEETRSVLTNAVGRMPYANLEDGRKHRKAHGIKGATEPRARR